MPTFLIYQDLTRQRLFTLETYEYSLIRYLQFFIGQLDVTGHPWNRDAFHSASPFLRANPFQGALPFTKKRELLPGLPPVSLGSLALLHMMWRLSLPLQIQACEYISFSAMGNVDHYPTLQMMFAYLSRPTYKFNCCSHGILLSIDLLHLHLKLHFTLAFKFGTKICTHSSST